MQYDNTSITPTCESPRQHRKHMVLLAHVNIQRGVFGGALTTGELACIPLHVSHVSALMYRLSSAPVFPSICCCVIVRKWLLCCCSIVHNSEFIYLSICPSASHFIYYSISRPTFFKSGFVKAIFKKTLFVCLFIEYIYIWISLNVILILIIHIFLYINIFKFNYTSFLHLYSNLRCLWVCVFVNGGEKC